MSTKDGITTINHSKSGASARIHEFGATVLGFTNAAGRDVIFVSRDAKLDGSKPVRGGIPLVFPIFGAPPDEDSTMPQHGFARNNNWTLLSTTDDEASASAKYALELSTVTNGRGTKNDWEGDKLNVKLIFCVEITATQMTTTMTVQNIGSTSFPFQCLFHTYYTVDKHGALDGSKCFVIGLEGYSSHDKLTNTTQILDGSPVVIKREVDCINTPPGDKLAAEVEIGVNASQNVKLTCSGEVDGKSVPVSVVVWNPHEKKAASLGDFGNDQFNDMICVEPGLLRGDSLAAGKEAKMVQTISG